MAMTEKEILEDKSGFLHNEQIDILERRQQRFCNLCGDNKCRLWHKCQNIGAYVCHSIAGICFGDEDHR